MRHIGLITVLLAANVSCAEGGRFEAAGGADVDWSAGATGGGEGGSGGSNTTSTGTSATAGGGGDGGGGASSQTSGGGGVGGGDETPPTVLAVWPTDGAVAVPSATKVEVTFSEPMDATTLDASTDGSCSGAIQLSSDDFASCVAFSGGVVTADDLSFSLTPAAPLGSLAELRLRVTTAAQDLGGNALAQTFETPTGFRVAFRHTITIDGVNDFVASSDLVPASTAGASLYVTHDESALYVGLSSVDIAPGVAGDKFLYFLFSVDPSLATGSAVSSDGKAKFGAGKKVSYHWKERIVGGSYSEFRIGDAAGWAADWGPQNKTVFVTTGFAEAKILLTELGGAAPSSVSVTAYTVDYGGAGGDGWVYNMLSGATDGPATAPRDLVQHLRLSLPADAAPNDPSHVLPF